MAANRFLIRNRYTFLFFTLLIFLLAYPYTEGRGEARLLVAGLTFLVLLIGCLAAADTTRRVVIAAVLSLPALLNVLAALFTGEVWFGLEGNVLMIPFYFYMMLMLARTVLHPTKVNQEMLFAGLSIYIILGFMFSQLYAAVYAYNPNSFSYASEYYPNGLGWYDFLYFSFVTLTTLGYGDIYPILATARGLAIVQAICGVMFLATMVAELVGIAASQRSNGDEG